MAEVKIKVEGMRCQNCVDKVEKFVGELDGVSLIDVDLSTKSVRVEFDSPATESEIKEAILDAGFEIV